jgi:malonate transporter and related proteins
VTYTIISALLPMLAILILGFLAGWHQSFDGKQAAILNRMVMLYALPLSLFAGMLATPRDQVLAQATLALAILLAMVVPYAATILIACYLFRRELATSSLQALAIAGPAVPFVGVSVLGQMFGNESAIPISVTSLAMNLIQVPATLMLLSIGTAHQQLVTGVRAPMLGSHIVHALCEPVVWAPVLALVLVLFNVQSSAPVQESLLLLGKATGGVALFASGIVLFSRRVAISVATGISVLTRTILGPAITWAALLLAGFAHEPTREVVLTIAIPTASICVILAVQYRIAEQEMASTLFFSTVLSVVTMGGLIWLTA